MLKVSAMDKSGMVWPPGGRQVLHVSRRETHAMKEVENISEVTPRLYNPSLPLSRPKFGVSHSDPDRL